MWSRILPRIAGAVAISALFALLTAIAVTGDRQVTALQRDPLTPAMVTVTDFPGGFTVRADRRESGTALELSCGNTLEPAGLGAWRLFRKGVVNDVSVGVSILQYPDAAAVQRQIGHVIGVYQVCRHERHSGTYLIVDAAAGPDGPVAVHVHAASGSQMALVYAPAGRYLVVVYLLTDSNPDLALAARISRARVTKLAGFPDGSASVMPDVQEPHPGR